MSKIYVYILSSIEGTTLYIELTSTINKRIWHHKQGLGSKFGSKYNCTLLIYTEEFESISDAIARE